ncbi:Efflux pump [Lachnellula hyalina]|uniref:Efflux pump n=1 Tax=Lachnellula hyalina TaxID=1316788 RepID=A0A8H8R6K6_9HELO|nr:Efflux pump [Lachnellula hyalina]TVY28470.1 Efflux pump [Lachnellula hyalina]
MSAVQPTTASPLPSPIPPTADFKQDSQPQQNEKSEGGDEDTTCTNAENEKAEEQELASWKLVLLSIALCSSLFCISLDGTILATAIPKITNHFNSLDDVAWYGSSYLFTTCAVQLVFGVAVFEVGSLICGTAPTSAALIVGRSIAGLGAAGIFTGAILIIATNVPLRQRPIYTALLSSMHAIASVAGPLLGGVFTDHVTWRWCFYINLPFGGMAILFIVLFLPSTTPPQSNFGWKEKVKAFDLIGTFFLIPGVICLLLALQWGGAKYPWDNARIIALFVVFGVMMVVFIGVEFWQKDRATVPLRILKDRNILGAVWFGVCMGGALFIFTYYLPIWFQAIQGVSATQSGIRNLPSILGLVVFSLIGGGLVTAVGYYTPFLILSSVVTAVGAGMLSTLKTNSRIGEWLGYQILLSAGAGLGAQNVMLVPQVASAPTDQPIAISILIFTQTLSSAIFLSVAQNVFQNQLIRNLHSYAPDINSSFVIQTGVTLLRENFSPEKLPRVLEAYNEAIVQTFYVAVAMAAASILGPVFMNWLSLKTSKKVESQNEEEGVRNAGTNSGEEKMSNHKASGPASESSQAL